MRSRELFNLPLPRGEREGPREAGTVRGWCRSLGLKVSRLPIHPLTLPAPRRGEGFGRAGSFGVRPE
jgi:hypothetical protein